MNILRLRAVDGGGGNEFQNQWLSESGPFHFTGFSDFATRRVPKEEGKPPSQPCLASSECFVMASSLRNQLGPRVLSCKCGFWVRMVIRQMGLSYAAARHQAKANLEAGTVGSEDIRMRTGLGTSAECPLEPCQGTSHHAWKS